MLAGARYASVTSFIDSGLSGPYAMPAIVVASPIPVMPSLQNTFTSMSVWPCMVATESLWGRIVGRSTRQVSMRSIVAEVIAIGSVRPTGCWPVRRHVNLVAPHSSNRSNVRDVIHTVDDSIYVEERACPRCARTLALETSLQNLWRMPTRTVLWRSLVEGVRLLIAATAAVPVESMPDAFWYTPIK